MFADKIIDKVNITEKWTDTGTNGLITMFTGSDGEQHPYQIKASGDTKYLDLYFLYGARNEFRLTYDPSQATDAIPKIKCKNEDGSPDSLESFIEYSIAAADERGQTIRNFIDIVNIDRNSSGKPTLVEHEALDSLNDMIAKNLYCPIGEIGKEDLNPMKECLSMFVGTSKEMKFGDFLANKNGEGVSL